MNCTNCGCDEQLHSEDEAALSPCVGCDECKGLNAFKFTYQNCKKLVLKEGWKAFDIEVSKIDVFEIVTAPDEQTALNWYRTRYSKDEDIKVRGIVPLHFWIPSNEKGVYSQRVAELIAEHLIWYERRGGKLEPTIIASTEY